jgi:hypothetical protein
MVFRLKSSAFDDEQQIPPKYMADGENLSPPLEWSDAPPGTKSFALIVEDPDAPSGVFRHWGLYNIMAERTSLPEGMGDLVKSEHLGVGVNDFGEPRYSGPAPPRWHGAHHHHFKLAALDVESLTQGPAMSVTDIWKTAQKHILDQAELVGTYAR